MITRLYYEVAYHPTGDHDHVEHVDQLEVTHADQVRAELHLARTGAPKMDQAPIYTTTAWVWAALVRTRVYDGKFEQFWQADLIGFENADDPATVDPTEDPSGSASPSPEPSETPATG